MANKVVVGFGKTGLSAVRYWCARGESVLAMDTRSSDFDESALLAADEVVVSPGVSLQTPALVKAKQAGVSLIGDVELFAREWTPPVVAITGTNGKSTVTDLVGHLAAGCGVKAAVGGNIGIPVLELLAAPADCAVLELSSFQLETTFSLRPRVAAILNATPDHLDRYEGFADYVTAKQRILEGAEIAVLNQDDPVCRELTLPASVKTVKWFSLDSPDIARWGLDQGLPVKGRHFIANALAALMIGDAMGWPMDKMRAALKTYRGLAHRCEWVACLEGVDWFNDSKATNVGATCAAIAGLAPEVKGELILIAGGQGKSADFTPLQTVMAQVSRLILFGEDAAVIEQATQKQVAVRRVADLNAAIECARQRAQAGDVVLFSPACASFDMFENFEHRGECFKAWVLANVRKSAQAAD